MAQFHIVAADGLGPEAWWAAPHTYTRNLQRFLSSTPIAAGGQVHQAAIVGESDRVLRGNGATYAAEYADLRKVGDSSKTLWEFSDGDTAWVVRIRTWDLSPLGSNVWNLAFDLVVVEKR